jgi:tetratricopeptide (TPR) repeat protein
MSFSRRHSPAFVSPLTLAFLFLLSMGADLDASAATSDTARRHYEHGAQLLAEGQYDGAMRELKKAVELKPKFAEAYHLLGLVYFHGHKQAEEAVQEIRRAIELDPKLAAA